MGWALRPLILSGTAKPDTFIAAATGRRNSEDVSSPSMGLALGIDQVRVGAAL